MALIGVEGGTFGEWPQESKQGGPGVRRYDVTINGVETTLLLSDEDAKARGLLVEKKAPAKKAAEPVESKQRTPANKARAPRAAKG